MSASIPRYVVESHSHDTKTGQLAVDEAKAICTRGSIDEIHLLVEAKKCLAASAVGPVLGPSACKMLNAGKRVEAAPGLHMSLLDIRSFKNRSPSGMIMGIYLSEKGLDVLDSVLDAQAILFLPWLEEEGKMWMDTWHPTILGQKTWFISESVINPKADEELADLTHAVNLGDGATHPGDVRRVRRTLADLKRLGILPPPEEIRRWALRHNWSPIHARRLKYFAEQESR